MQCNIHTNYFFCLPAKKNANAPCTTIKIIYDLIPCETCKLPCYLVQLICLAGIGLKKGGRGNFELKLIHFFNNEPLSKIDLRLKVADTVIPFRIHCIK